MQIFPESPYRQFLNLKQAKLYFEMYVLIFPLAIKYKLATKIELDGGKLTI